MVETLLNPRTGAAAPADSQRSALRAQARASVSAAPVRADASAPAAPLTASSVAPGLLIAAQQVRESDRLRTFDARQAYGGPAGGNGAPSPGESEGTPGDQGEDGQGADIVPFPPAARQTGLRAASGAQPDAFSRANRAYVHAGAADGRAFAQNGLDTSALRPSGNTFEQLV